MLPRFRTLHQILKSVSEREYGDVERQGYSRKKYWLNFNKYETNIDLCSILLNMSGWLSTWIFKHCFLFEFSCYFLLVFNIIPLKNQTKDVLKYFLSHFLFYLVQTTWRYDTLLRPTYFFEGSSLLLAIIMKFVSLHC